MQLSTLHPDLVGRAASKDISVPRVGWPVPEARGFIRDLTEYAISHNSPHAHQ